MVDAGVDPDSAWAAFEVRDRSQDGRFVGAVRTTGIYCKPSCPARRPLRTNVEFFESGEAARAAGYRACLRCRPDDVAREDAGIAAALALITASEGRVPLAALATAAGYAPHHFHRLFKRATGITPAAYMRAAQAQRGQTALVSEPTVTEAIYAAGYSGPGRFYAQTGARLGMRPSAWAKGGAGVTIRWAIADTSLGPMLIAATDKGICRLAFDEDDAALRTRFPQAQIEPGGADFADLVRGAVAAVETPATMPSLPLDVQGTAFQQAVWAELQRIPPGETRTYAQLAAAIGHPNAVRAAGTANGANHIAILIPCHRVIRTDGTLGGYAYGLERKRALLAREGVSGARLLQKHPPSRTAIPLLSGMTRRGRLTTSQTRRALSLLAGLPIRLDHDSDEATLLALARQHQLTAYDAAYLELAQRHGAPLATLDEALCRAAREVGLVVIGDGG